MVSSAIVYAPYGTATYILGIGFLLWYSLKESYNRRLGGTFYLFIASVLMSSILNLTINYKVFMILITFFACTPITMSRKIVLFRESFLFYFLSIFPCLMLLSSYCFIRGISAYKGDALDFSAFFPHPMWLGAALGLSNVTLLWYTYHNKNMFCKLVVIILLLCSLLLTVISGSRSALAASLITFLVFIIIRAKSLVNLGVVVLFVSCVSFFALPVVGDYSGKMKLKFELGENYKYGSRTILFERAIDSFVESPVWGTGFQTKKVNKKDDLSFKETGSGWISVAVQMGVVGVLVLLFMFARLVKVLRYIICQKDEKLLLFAFAFLYLCLHSLFEGYILTPGYYLCLLFWSLLGYLYSYPYYAKRIRFHHMLNSFH